MKITPSPIIAIPNVPATRVTVSSYGLGVKRRNVIMYWTEKNWT